MGRSVVVDRMASCASDCWLVDLHKSLVSFAMRWTLGELVKDMLVCNGFFKDAMSGGFSPLYGENLSRLIDPYYTRFLESVNFKVIGPGSNSRFDQENMCKLKIMNNSKPLSD